MEIRIADNSNIEDISYLNMKWSNLKDISKGFIKNPFDINQITSLVERQNIIVAYEGKVIAGYYLVNDLFITKEITKREETVKNLISLHLLPSGNYAFHTQGVVDDCFMKKGISRQMLTYLRGHLYLRFDYLVGCIYKDNLNAKIAHIKSGWDIFMETESGWLAYVKTIRI